MSPFPLKQEIKHRNEHNDEEVIINIKHLREIDILPD